MMKLIMLMIILVPPVGFAAPQVFFDNGKYKGIEEAVSNSPASGRTTVAEAQLDVCYGKDAVNQITERNQCLDLIPTAKAHACDAALAESLCKAQYLCSVDQHEENSYCESNQKMCQLSFGTGIMTWNPLAQNYGSCLAISCQSGYEIQNGNCVLSAVTTAAQFLQKLALGTGVIKLGSDIALPQTSTVYVLYFSGTIDGQGFKLSGLTAPLAQTLEKTNVMNLKIDTNIPSSFINAGALAVDAKGVILNNVNVTGTVLAQNTAGGLFATTAPAPGVFATQINKSSFIGNVTSLQGPNVGGLVGYSGATYFEKSYARGVVSVPLTVTSGVSAAGGLVGQFAFGEQNNIFNCYFDGNVSGGHAGGIAGRMERIWYISNSYVNGEVTGGSSAGGIVGLNGGPNGGGIIDWDMSTSKVSGPVGTTGTMVGTILGTGGLRYSAYLQNSTINTGLPTVGGNSPANYQIYSDITQFYQTVPQSLGFQSSVWLFSNSALPLLR